MKIVVVSIIAWLQVQVLFVGPNKMLHILNKIPYQVTLACSGGADSMAALHFLKNGGREIKVCYFNHGTEFGALAQTFIQDYCSQHKIDLEIGTICSDKSKQESWEEYWRNQRYNWFKKFQLPMVMAHNLNDQMENWIFTSAHGLPRLIPYINGLIIRPFLLNLKSEMVNWCLRHQVPWIEDPSNQDTKYMRNKIRHEILPKYLELNPGFPKVIRKQILKQIKGE